MFAALRPSTVVYDTILDSSTHATVLVSFGFMHLDKFTLGLKKLNPGATPWYISSILLNCNVKGTVLTSRLAMVTVDWPPLICMYYLPYKRGKLKKLDLFSGSCSLLIRRLQ